MITKSQKELISMSASELLENLTSLRKEINALLEETKQLDVKMQSMKQYVEMAH
ncbi:MAG: hypothetical protein K6G26_01015 [Lachnospiraceae bacterium]|nr:hypothetical protein [Lachnospiraceae bacterium]